MLRFAVYDENGLARDWPLVNAHLLGPDDLAVRGAVTFREGLIECPSRGRSATALCLQHDAGRMGRLLLQTCLLPDRERPYSLTIELARHRIKEFIAKSEEWQMFDLSDAHPAMRLWEKARQLLTQAMTTTDPVRAGRVAQSSLESAINASERLAMAHAEILLHRRYASRAASSSTLGVRVWPDRDGKQLRELIQSNFDLLVIPLRWKNLEVEEGVYQWGAVDRWMEWAKQQGKPIVAGPLLDFSKEAMPAWMSVWQHDYDTCRDMVFDHLERVVERYKSVVGMWNIASGLNTNEHFEFDQSQMLDMARMASLLVRQKWPGARTMLELRQPFAEFRAVRRDSLATFAFVDRLVSEGIKLDALGVQLVFGQRQAGRATRDLMQISSLLDKFFVFELPVLVSALGAPSETVDLDGGTWHEAWNPELQARWAGRLFAVAMSKPYVESVFWTDLYDHEKSVVPKTGLITDTGQPKPALARLVGARRRLRKPLGSLALPDKAVS